MMSNTFTLYCIARKRLSTDGEGITDLVGLSGCPMVCKYCINREMLSSKHYHTETPSVLLGTVSQEACYFYATGGGITFGGGEPLLQSGPIIEFASLRPAWMRITLETALQAEKEVVEDLVPYIDEWIVDIKSLDRSVYKEYTGGGNYEYMRGGLDVLRLRVPEKCCIRIPIIPGYKDEELARTEEKVLKKMGFAKTDVFNYIVPDNSKVKQTKGNEA